MSDPNASVPDAADEYDFLDAALPLRNPASRVDRDSVEDRLPRTRVDRLRMDDLNVSPRTAAVLRELGLWRGDRVLDVSREALQRAVREVDPLHRREQ